MANKMIGKYELLEELGRGGFGTVYRARDTSLEVERAVKVLHPMLASDPEFITRFKREAQFAARLEHPAIVPVYEFGELDGAYFLMMKYMPGGSLKDLLKNEKRLPFVRALGITRQIAGGLDRAHKQGLVHRDIKPGNILFEEADAGTSARLSDFGFAKALSGADSTSLSASGGMVGTPAYMAPEVWKGEEISPMADIYSLACVFFEMLTGQVLFDGNSPAQIMTRHVLESPKFPEKWPEGTPKGIQTVLALALEKEPARRYQSAGAFGKALEYLTGEEQSNMETTPQKIVFQVQVETFPAIPAVEEEKKLNAQTVPAGSPSQIGSNSNIPPSSFNWDRKPVPKIPLPAAGVKLRPRFAEKSVPYLLTLLGLTTGIIVAGGVTSLLKVIFLVISILALIAGIGLFWHKNWARKLGMVFAGILEITGIIAACDGLSTSFGVDIYFLVICLAVFLLALFFMNTLGGKRMSTWTGGGNGQPAGFWPIFTGFAATFLGLFPAVMLLKHRLDARFWAWLYASFLLIFFLVVTMIFKLFLHGLLISPMILLIGLCLWAIFTLQSRRFREEYEG